MPEKSSFSDGGPVYDLGDVTVYIQHFLERFRAIEAQLAAISQKLEIPYETPAESVPPEVMELVQTGRRLEAVAANPELTGASFDQARGVISRLWLLAQPRITRSIPTALDNSVRASGSPPSTTERK